MNNEVWIRGAAMTCFGKHLDRSARDLVEQAVVGAMADAEIEAAEVQTAYVGNAVSCQMNRQESIRGQVDLRRTAWTGKEAEERLAEVRMTVNRNTVPFDERPPTVASGFRVGTPAATMRGFDEDDFREVGRIICEALTAEADLEALAGRSLALCERRPLYPGFRGYTTFVTEVS